TAMCLRREYGTTWSWVSTLEALNAAFTTSFAKPEPSFWDQGAASSSTATVSVSADAWPKVARKSIMHRMPKATAVFFPWLFSTSVLIILDQFQQAFRCV